VEVMEEEVEDGEGDEEEEAEAEDEEEEEEEAAEKGGESMSSSCWLGKYLYSLERETTQG